MTRAFLTTALIAGIVREGVVDGMLVGDSGYAYRSYLMTPVLNPRNEGEVRYNIGHRRTIGVSLRDALAY